MRASCETDLMQQHPIHVVTAWIGNTPKIALTHYLQTNDSDCTKAIGEGAAKSAATALQNTTPSPTITNCHEVSYSTKAHVIEGLRELLIVRDGLRDGVQVAKVGLEPTRLLGARF
jgi:hypothetical protein